MIHNIDVLEGLKRIPGDRLFDLSIADPPYNIGKDFGNESDKQTLEQYVNWSMDWIHECLRLTKTSAPIYIYGFPEVLAHLSVKLPLKNQRWLVWHYTNKTVPSSVFWQRSYESILCIWTGSKPKLRIDDIREAYTDSYLRHSAGRVRKSKECRYSAGDSITTYRAHENGALPRDVLKVPALAGGAGYAERMFYCISCDKLASSKERAAHSACKIIIHPTQKPFALTQNLMKASVSSGQKVLIPFAGSGSECIVAQRMGLDFYATELNPDYVKLGNAWLQSDKYVLFN